MTQTRSKRSPVRDQMLVFGAPLLGEAEIEEVVATLRSGWIGTGPRVQRFQQEFAAYKGVAEAAAVNSCTAALHLSLVAAGLSAGDEVITTPLTFCATVNAILHAGATPVLADVDPLTMNIDPEQIERRITSRTRAVLIVHFAGRPCAMDAILDLCQRHNLLLIEDCAHAIETTWHGRHAGTFGDFGCFSFYVTKNATTGEGGMVLARAKDALDRVRVLALHGMTRDAWKRFSDSGYKHYQVVEQGFKYNMTDLQAALGSPQLRRIDSNWQVRRDIWNRYDQALRDLPLVLPAAPEPDTRHACHLYTLLVDETHAHLTRDEFLAEMTAANIGIGVHYVSLPEHPLYQHKLGWKPEAWPHAQRIGRQTVSLPLSPKMSYDDVEDVVEAVRRIWR